MNSRRFNLISVSLAILFLALATGVLGADAAKAGLVYALGPDSMTQEGVPHGDVTKHQWESKVFPGTVRDYWVYVPKQYDAAKPCTCPRKDVAAHRSSCFRWISPL